MTTKNHNKKLIKDLERLFRNEKTPYPVKIKNTIYVGFYGANKQANGLYKVFNIKNKQHLHTTFSKPAAIALAKVHATNFSNHYIKLILELDQEYSKHCLDQLFFKNSLEQCKDSDKLDVIETRLEITIAKIDMLEHKLNFMVLRNY